MQSDVHKADNWFTSMFQWGQFVLARELFCKKWMCHTRKTDAATSPLACAGNLHLYIYTEIQQDMVQNCIFISTDLQLSYFSINELLSR